MILAQARKQMAGGGGNIRVGNDVAYNWSHQVWLTAILFVLTTSSVRSAEPLVLAEKKKALLPIIVAPTSHETVRHSASELASFLNRICGAEFEVVTGERPRKGIFVGTSVDFPIPEFKQSLRIRENHDGVEAFVIAPREGSIYLLGGADTGVSHAVYRFLERLGCRWYFPAPQWEVIPKRDRIVADFEEAGRPKMWSRRITPGAGFFGKREGRCQQEVEAWRRHNRMANSIRINNGHAWQTIIAQNENLFAEHPEYLALVKGKRRKPQFCVSNPAVRKIAVDWALRQLELRPELDVISMECSDGINHCECRSCLEMGSVSDRVFGLANEVARAVSKKFPGKSVGMLAYGNHSEPPSFDLEPNVHVQLTTGFLHGEHTFDQLLALWPRKVRSFGIYEYYSIWPWDHDQLPGGKANDIAQITGLIRRYAAAGVTSMNCESGNNWGLHGRGYYVANRLMWDPETDVDALLADFYKTAFGPADEVMRRFYERFDRGNQPLMSEHLLGLGFRDIAEACQLAANRPDVLSRLNQLKQYLHYVRLRWDLDELPKLDSRRKALTLEALTWVYRTRYTYMNHWEIMRQIWTRAAAKEFDEPSWSYRYTKSKNPWADDTPVSPAETDKVFRDDALRFHPQEGVEDLSFSQDLVPLFSSAPAVKDPVSLDQLFQRTMHYALFSRSGEPFRFSIRTQVIKIGDKPAGRWKVTNKAGDLIMEGRLPQDGQAHPIEAAVPQPGLYWLAYDDNGSGWEIRFQPGTLVCLAPEKGKRLVHLGPFRQPVFFFVPKGARNLQFLRNGGTLKTGLHGPNGSLVYEMSADDNGKIVRVEVPSGMDGKPWSIDRFSARQFWLMNAPNYFSASPSSLLVPKEVRRSPE